MKASDCKNLLFAFFLLTILPLLSYGQRDDVLMTNSKTFEIEAYKDIEGTPYYFEEWQMGKVYGKEKAGETQEPETHLLNFNGYSKSFEVRKDNRFITLDENYYSKIVIETTEKGQQKSTVFKTNTHPIYKNRFMKVVFEGTDFTVIQDYQIKLSNREKQGYAAKENIQEFANNSTYYFVKNGKAKSIKLKKKALVSLLKNQEGAIAKFVKKHKLKLNKEEDLVQLFSYFEQLEHPNGTVAVNEN